MISLDDVTAAARRIEGRVRRTPVLRLNAGKTRIAEGDIAMKLESLQVTGSFKARGAISKLTALAPEEVKRGIITASGGNHGIAVAYAGWVAGIPATIYVPSNVSPLKAEKIRSWGANLVIEGDVWDDANRVAMRVAETEGLTYFHPFADDAVMAGQGTIVPEILADHPEIDTLVIAIGGGGLISGMSIAAKALLPDVRIIGVEPVGAPTLHASLAAGRIVELPEITTIVPTMAARKTEPVNFEIAQRHVAEVVLVTDEEMRTAAQLLWFEYGIAADLSGAASVAALLAGKVKPQPGERICGLVCGAGADGVA